MYLSLSIINTTVKFLLKQLNKVGGSPPCTTRLSPLTLLRILILSHLSGVNHQVQGEAPQLYVLVKKNNN